MKVIEMQVFAHELHIKNLLEELLRSHTRGRYCMILCHECLAGFLPAWEVAQVTSKSLPTLGK